MDHFRLGAPHLDGRWIVCECPEAGRHVEDLIVQQRADQFVQFPAAERGLLLKLAEFFLQNGAAIHRDLNVPQVAGELRGECPQSGRAFAAAQFGRQLDDASSRLHQIFARVGNGPFIRVGSELAVPGFGDEARRAAGEGGRELPDLYCPGQRRHVLGVDLPLDPADLEERDQRDDAREQGEDDGRAEARRDLDPQALPERKLPAKPTSLLRGFGAGRRLAVRGGEGRLEVAEHLLALFFFFFGGAAGLPRQRFAERSDDRDTRGIFLLLRNRLPGLFGDRIPAGVPFAVSPVVGFFFGHPVTSGR